MRVWRAWPAPRAGEAPLDFDRRRVIACQPAGKKSRVAGGAGPPPRQNAFSGRLIIGSCFRLKRVGKELVDCRGTLAQASIKCLHTRPLSLSAILDTGRGGRTNSAPPAFFKR